MGVATGYISRRGNAQGGRGIGRREDDLRRGCKLAQPLLLLLGRSWMGEFVTENGWRMGDQRLDNVLLQTESKFQVRPCLIPVLQHRQPEDEIVHVLDIALSSPLVAQAKNDVVDFDIGKDHVIGRSGHHLRKVVCLLFLRAAE